MRAVNFKTNRAGIGPVLVGAAIATLVLVGLPLVGVPTTAQTTIGGGGTTPKAGKKRETIPVQEMLLRVDEVLKIPAGLLTGRLSAVTKTGKSAVWDFSLYRKTIVKDGLNQTAMLYVLSSKRRGLEAKILFRENGDEIWLWDAVRGRLFRKRDLEKYQGVLGTGFSYLELSGAEYQATYTGRRAVLLRTPDKKVMTRMTMVPINPGLYSKLRLLADQQKEYRPVRIDFHGRRKVLHKTLNFYYGDILLKDQGRTSKTRLPVRLEMLDLRTGVISRMEYFSVDKRVNPDNAFFDPDYLNR